MLTVRRKYIITAGLAALLVAGCLAAVHQPAQARLDELLSSDKPYLAAPASEQTKQPSDRPAVAVPRVYVVRNGDTLSQVALRHGLDADRLAEINGLRDADRIVKGQVLMLPGNAIPYQVGKGETLSSIALRFGCSEDELVKMNQLRHPDCLLTGQQLMIPAGQGGGDSQVSRGLPLSQLSWPAVGWISSPYGMRNGAMHEGIDIAADQGQPVRAAKDGKIVFAGPRGTYGIAVIIDHGNGLRTLYAHNSRVLVSEGQRVSAGQRIALIGSTGRSTGPHLHFEVLLNGIPVDPLLCLERAYA
ncbi:M23 family metallopeptidase [Desulfoscipio sp. XC116]|uniref:M23 family metallopeptidase n=1 Tax=Desulfoscipio sp. XC116 TaxID=3144975 RepID=UPI00325B723F